MDTIPLEIFCKIYEDVNVAHSKQVCKQWNIILSSDDERFIFRTLMRERYGDWKKRDKTITWQRLYRIARACKDPSWFYRDGEGYSIIPNYGGVVPRNYDIIADPEGYKVFLKGKRYIAQDLKGRCLVECANHYSWSKIRNFVSLYILKVMRFDPTKQDTFIKVSEKNPKLVTYIYTGGLTRKWVYVPKAYNIKLDSVTLSQDLAKRTDVYIKLITSLSFMIQLRL